MEPGEHWKEEPEIQDFPVGASYLSLMVGSVKSTKMSKALRQSQKLQHYAAKDILRAAQLPLPDAEDSEVSADLRVSADLEKVENGERLSPVLLVQRSPLWIADGYHRVCLDDKTLAPCRTIER